MISFVFCFHSARTSNLEQTLRLLFKRETNIGEVILVCNDETERNFPGCKLHNMRMDTYRKTTMCNFGVAESKFETIALLDSDRVLPNNYFSSIKIHPGQFVSCDHLANMSQEYSDEEIEGEISKLMFEVEIKSRKAEIRRKNLFSGNTMFLKSDYLNSGGMDESFVGYGFADNDMTMNIISKGYEPVWRDEVEIHLWHEKNIFMGGQKLVFPEFKYISTRNMNKFLSKWNPPLMN
jgi:hypothetical protein